MKLKTLLYPTLIAVPFALISCDNFNQPLGDGGGYNPLDPPGAAQVPVAETNPYGSLFKTGAFLQTVSPNTAFFSKFPTGNDQPSKTLAESTDVKVISTKGSYVKIEVIDTGEVGFVPGVMLGEKRAAGEVPVTPEPGEIPVTPGIAPEAPANPDTPPVAPEPEVPSIEPPQAVDPSQPAE